jgi:hypothetical protein
MKNFKQAVFDCILSLHFITRALLAAALSICTFRMIITTNNDYLSNTNNRRVNATQWKCFP